MHISPLDYDDTSMCIYTRISSSDIIAEQDCLPLMDLRSAGSVEGSEGT